MATNWGPPAAPSGETAAAVTVLLIGLMEQANGPWYQQFAADARFRVVGVGNTPDDFRSKMTMQPEVVVLNGTVMQPQELVRELSPITTPVMLCVPPNVDAKLVEQLRALPGVAAGKLYLGDPNLHDLVQAAHACALRLRESTPALPASAWGPGKQPQVALGLRVVVVWSRSGGVGRSTIAVALGQALARRGVHPLLIGLGAPDPLPLMLGLKPDPNITAWYTNPGDDTLRASIQTTSDGLAVLTGFPDMLSEDVAARQEDAGGNLFGQLVTAAAYGGYGAIILDASPGGLAARAISAASLWLLVERPTVAGAWSAVDAFRMVTQRAAGTHRIPIGGIRVVLNGKTNVSLTVDDWHRGADTGARNVGLQFGIPPIASVIPWDPEITRVQDAGRSALEVAAFSKEINRLADALFGAAGSQVADSGATRKIGPLRIKTK